MNIIENWFKNLYDIGETKDKGVTRLAYSKEEEEMHNKLIDFAKKEGFNYKRDYLGNTFIFNGELKKDYVLIGSHLDSVLNGGRYDGVIGVLAGLRVLRYLKDENIDENVMLALFRAEESTVFNQSTIGSSFASGALSLSDLENIKNEEGTSLKNILEKKNYTEDKDFRIIDYTREYLEVHIEQGRILWDKDIDIGIVIGIAAPQRFKLTIKGEQDHSGATPMDMRKDALAGGAQIITSIESLGLRERKYGTVATVGTIKIEPGSINVIPGSVTLGIDIRGINKSSINNLIEDMKIEIEKICKNRNLEYELDYLSGGEPVLLKDRVTNKLEKIVGNLDYSYKLLPSGAGHDAMEFGRKVDTGMLFVPNKDGISHNSEEYARIEDLSKASKVLYKYIKNKDK